MTQYRGDVGESLGAKDAEELDEIDLPEEEVRPMKGLKTPDMPTKAEVARHRVSHLPYRSWCPECVEGFGREWAHKTSEEERSV